MSSSADDTNIDEQMGFERNAGDDIDDMLMCFESELATADRVAQDYTLQITSVEEKCKTVLPICSSMLV